MKEDTAALNSITAAEFCYKNPSLTRMILNLLSECIDHNKKAKILASSREKTGLEGTGAIKDKGENSGVMDEGHVNPVHPFLVPVLSLLARLNPGTEIQQSDDIKFVLDSSVSCLFEFLDNPIFAVRRLASSALINLSSHTKTKVEQSLEIAIGLLSNPRSSSNLIHGCLLFMSRSLAVCPNLFESRALKERVTSCLVQLAGINLSFINRTLVVDILSQLEHSLIDVVADYNCLNFVSKPIDTDGHTYFSSPGYALYTRAIVQSCLSRDGDYISFVLSDNQDIREEAYCFVAQKLKNSSLHQEKLIELEKAIWAYLSRQRLETLSRHCVRIGQMFDLLSLLFVSHLMNVELAESCVPLLEILLSRNIMSKSVVILVAYMMERFRAENKTSDRLQRLCLMWARVVYNATSPRVSEDYRLAASKALAISLKTNFVHSEPNTKEFAHLLVKASFNLLQDENKAVRESSTAIVQHLRGECLVNVSPSVATTLLVNSILKPLIHGSNFNVISLLWDLCFEHSLELIKSNYTGDNHSIKLFESTTDNPYKEPQGIADMICSRLGNIAKDSEGKDILKEKLKTEANFLEQFTNSKIKELHLINETLPKSLSSNEFVNWNIVHKLTVVKNGLQFLEALKSIYKENYDINLKGLDIFPT